MFLSHVEIVFLFFVLLLSLKALDFSFLFLPNEHITFGNKFEDILLDCFVLVCFPYTLYILTWTSPSIFAFFFSL